MTPENIKYECMNLQEISDCIHGYSKIRMEIGDIDYYHGLPYGNENHIYFVASIESPSKNCRKILVERIVGMLDLQFSPYESDVVWLMSIAVENPYRNLGIAKKLSEQMCEYLRDKPLRLERSTPSEDGLKYIKSVIDRMVQEYKIPLVEKVKMNF